MTDPTTHAALWDELQTLFGFGGYSESSDVPYHQYRRTGIAILRKTLERRDLTISEVWKVAQYCAADRTIVVRSYNELLGYTSRAQAAVRAVVQGWSDRTFEQRLQVALDIEMDPDVRGQLLRAAPEAREQVLTEWEERHHV